MRKDEQDEQNSNPEEYKKLIDLRINEIIQNATQEDLPDGFYYSNDQLMHQSTGVNKEGDPPPSTFISSRVDVTACTRDDANINHGRLLEFKDVDGIIHEWAMPMALLAGDGSAYREELLKMGLHIAPGSKPRQLLTHFIQSSTPSCRARCVAKTGWYNSSFVFPNEVLDYTLVSEEAKEKVILQAIAAHFPAYDTSGTLEEWKQNVASLCKGNSRLVFAVSIAFAAPLLHLLDKENGGFHFRGSSSIGKTTALQVAASVWGSKEYMQRWRATTNPS